MENKKRIILITVVVLILIIGFALIVGQLTKPEPQTAQPVVPAAKVNNREKPVVTARDEKENLPTVEMGNAIGVVQSITADSLTVKTDDGKTLSLAIKKSFNVFAFTDKGSEQKNVSDVKTGSKVSVQYSKDNEVMSMYLMK
jgi:hypothetical protein